MIADVSGLCCTVCGKQPNEHGSYPTCASHPYNPDGRCGHVGTYAGGTFTGVPCAGAECQNGCAAISRLTTPAPAAPKEAQEPVAWVPYCHTDGETCIQGEYRWDEIAEKPCEMWDPEHWMCLPLYASPSQPQPASIQCMGDSITNRHGHFVSGPGGFTPEQVGAIRRGEQPQPDITDEELTRRYTRSRGGPNPFYRCVCGYEVPGVRIELVDHARACGVKLSASPQPQTGGGVTANVAATLERAGETPEDAQRMAREAVAGAKEVPRG